MTPVRRLLRPVGLLLASLLLVAAGGLTGTAAASPHDTARQSHHGHGGPKAPAPIRTYVALGDSYTAAPYVPTLQVADGCYRSTNNYPALVARALGATLTDRSCSGAQTKDMTTSQLPGVAPQFDSLSAGTDLVTVGIGGNDFSVFGTLVTYCPTLRSSDPHGAPCRDQMRQGGRDTLLGDVAQTSRRIETVVRTAHRLAPHARVLVVGYPQIAPRRGTCPDLLPLADGDYSYAVQVNKALTDALRHAAAVTGSTYVDLWGPSRGHDICAADPWINGQYTDPQRAQNFHPFAEEQEAAAGLVLRALAGHGRR